ncbi:methyl-accepting chemotaxis protein [Caryophanon latum]|uniref:Chemotaxis protein n=1 Tax=Caryophanon latum TaxID=33977 RepID=A0A1C0YDM3_9BACL|nr:methyl-accepting chemotaxis protein [Caryophanon latum]OCS85250.1 chemotaxis protein [Caryophanon latum]
MKKHAFSLRKQLVLFVVTLAVVTYTTSFLFIEFLYPKMFNNVDDSLFQIVTYALGVMWSGVLAAAFSLVLVRPLERLDVAAEKAAAGQIGSDIEVKFKRDDEINAVSNSFQKMLENLRTMVETIEANVETTKTTMNRLTDETTSTTKQAQAISETITHISKGADLSASAVQQTVHAIEEVRELAAEVNDRAESSANQSGEILKHLTTTNEVVSNLVNGIQAIAHGNEEALLHIKELEKNATQIEAINTLVGDIANQTNLLALNASIEAARAGEHGKGFAVVAEEVRKLADESAKAVSGITELIRTIQNNITTAVSQMEGQVTLAVQETARIHETTSTVNEMSAGVEQMATDIVEISQLVEQQMRNIHHTASQSQDVAAIAQQTSASAEEVENLTKTQLASIAQVNTLATLLDEQAANLFTSIEQFDRSK